MSEITLEGLLRDILYQMSRAEGQKAVAIANCFIKNYLNMPCFKLPVSRLNELVKVDRKEQEYMDIDEAIEHAKEISVTCENNKCAFEHSQLAEWLIQLKFLKTIISDNQDIIQLKNLIKADKEGRCVILPVKIGDFVYMPLLREILRLEIVEINATNYIPILKAGNAGLVFSFDEDDIGKGIFLTRDEAEQAMKERRNK